VTWIAHLMLPRGLLSDMQRDIARVQWSQAEILTRLKEIQAGPVSTRGAALAELWQLRDQLAETDPDLAARIHAIYNALVTGPDAG
jgi:hypothetical protein